MKRVIAIAVFFTPVAAIGQSADGVMQGIIRDAASGDNKPRAGYCRYEGFANWWHKRLSCFKRDHDGKLVRYYVRGN